MGPEGEDIELCKFSGKACPLVKTLAAAVAVLIFVLGFYIPWLNEKVDRVSGIETKVDMVLMILKGEIQIAKGD